MKERLQDKVSRYLYTHESENQFRRFRPQRHTMILNCCLVESFDASFPEATVQTETIISHYSREKITLVCRSQFHFS